MKRSIGKVFLFILLISSSLLWAQDDLSDDILIRQRAIFIYNLTQQVGWRNFDKLEEFKIGVLGNDLTASQLLAIAKTRTVKKKKIVVQQFLNIQSLEKVQLLYVNKRYNFNLNDVLSKIHGQNTLLVSENYSYNESMINIINVGGEFQFQLNERRLEEEKFIIPSSLKKTTISSLDKWQELYLASEKSLANERERVAQQKKLLRDQARLLRSQKEILSGQQNKLSQQTANLSRGKREIQMQREQIDQKNKEFDLLTKKSAALIKNYNAKVEELNELGEQIAEQKSMLDLQVAKVSEQRLVLDSQQVNINMQKEVLARQESELNLQRKLSYLLGCVIFLTFIATFFIYRSYRIKQKSNVVLSKKNQDIKEKTIELEIQNREMEQFAYVASHDLQEPLHTISGFIDILSSEYHQHFDAKGKKSLEFISEAAGRMRRLILELLEYSKIGEYVDFSPVDCNQVIIDIKADFQKRIQETDTKIYAAHLPVITGHATEIRLLFQNLISNAIKFQNKGTAPVIHIDCEEMVEDRIDYWKFSIRDNGIGIPPKYQSKIFAIFQRLHDRAAYRGTGIGLAHCRKIVELHKGRIWVTSELGQGSTFYFRIPKIVKDPAGV